MTSKLTREKAQWLHDACEEAAAAGIKLTMNPNELLMFTSYALAAMDSKPVAWRWRRGPDTRWHLASRGDLAGEVEPLYRHAQPAPERDQVRSAHAEWSQTTFGNVGPVGPLKHLSKEALEAAAEPGDLSEWADMQFLLWDAQRRAGITDEQITQAMIDKLAVNKQREWPEPKDGEPRLHIKEQPAPVVPVVPDFKKLARELVDNLVDCGGLDEGVKEKYLEWAEKTCHAAMFAAAPQSPGSEPATVPGKWIPVSERMPIEFEAVIAFDGDQVYGEAMYSSDDGFTIDGYEPCDRLNLQNVTHWMPLPAAPQEVKGE